MLETILIVILILAIVAALPRWPHMPGVGLLSDRGLGCSSDRVGSPLCLAEFEPCALRIEIMTGICVRLLLATIVFLIIYGVQNATAGSGSGVSCTKNVSPLR